MKTRLFAVALLALCLGSWGTTTTFKSVENMAFSTMSGGIDDDDLTIALATGTGSRFPSSGAFYVILFQDLASAYEVVLIDSRATDTLTVNASGRGAQSTSATSWASGTHVQMTWTSGQIEDVHNAINAIEAGTNDLAGVALFDDAPLALGDDGDMELRFDGTVLELVDAADNTMFNVTDGGGAGTLSVKNTITTGTSDNTAGVMSALGGTTTTGGTVNIYNAADSDTTVDLWSITSDSGDLEFRYDATAFMTVNDATGKTSFPGGLISSRMTHIPVSAMQGSAALTTATLGDFTVPSYNFDDSTDETVYVAVAMQGYDGGDVVVNIHQGHTAAATKINWVVYCFAAQDTESPVMTTPNDAIETAAGSGNYGRFAVVVTPDDAEVADTILFIAVSRDADDATNDTYSGDASLIGLQVYYTTTG